MKRLHTQSKIFFSNPYVLRVEYSGDQPESVIEAEHRALVRRAYRLINGTWGYSDLKPELVKIKDDFNHQSPPGPGHFAGMSAGLQIASIIDPDFQRRYRCYFCFKDELDALQFRLTISTNAVHVQMWPAQLFTIHEVVESDES